MKSKEILALVEFNKGCLLISDDNSKLALGHFCKSLKLHYNKERAEFIGKVKEKIREK